MKRNNRKYQENAYSVESDHIMQLFYGGIFNANVSGYL